MTTTNPLKSINDTIASSSRDYSIEARDAWIYGIVMGWDNASLQELKQLHGWSNEEIRRLKKLHRSYILISEASYVR